MADLNAFEVIQYVTALRDDQQLSRLRQDIDLRLRQHAMTDVPWVPDWLTAAGKTLVMNSPRIPELARQINAVMASYTTSITAVPGNPDLQGAADKAEKAYSVRRAKLFTPQVVGRAHWRQMIVAYDFYKLACGSVKSKDPWSIIQPDPQSCYFMMGEESMVNMRPAVMGREFIQMVRDRRKYYDPRQGRMPTYNGTTWDFEIISDDQAADRSLLGGTNVKGQFEPVKFYELDDSVTTYVVGMNKDGKSGEILWKRKNLTGGSTYVMVPGYMTGSVELNEKFLPHLWGPMNVQYQIDVINTLRATRSMNIKPQVLLERTPELLQAASQLGILRPIPEGYESQGSDTIIDVDGKPHFWVLPEDKDLAALEQSKQKELESLISTELALTQADVIKDAAVRNIQLALGVRAQQQGLMLTFEAIGEREILKMWAHSIECDGGYGADEWGLTALSDQGKVKKGEYVTAKKGMFEFDHHVEVSTASVSPQEQQFLIQAAVERKVSKISIWPEVLDAAGYQNRKEQQDLLVEEEGFEGASAFYGPWLEPVFRQRMAEMQGILIPASIPGQGETVQPNQMVPSPNAFPVPQTESSRGESQA